MRAAFLRERRAFARAFPGMAPVRGAELVVEDRRCSAGGCGFRDVAWATWGPPRVHLLRRALSDLAPENIVGLIRHELGHLADRDPWGPGSEQRADDLAESATGERVRYDRRDVQTVGRGRYPRPTNLPP